MVLPDSHGIPRAPRYLGMPLGRHILFAYRTFTYYGLTFQSCSAKNMFCNFPTVRYYNQTATRNTISANAHRLTAKLV